MAENNYSEHGSDTKIQIGDGGKKELASMGERIAREKWDKMTRPQKVVHGLIWLVVSPFRGVKSLFY